MAIDSFKNKTLEDYSEDTKTKFISAMEQGDCMKKCKADVLKFLLKKNNVIFEEDEIKHLYKLIKTAFDKPKEFADDFTLSLTKAMGLAELHKMLNDPNCKGELRLKVLDKIGGYSGWEDNKDAENIIKSNNELIATLNKLFTIQDQEYFAFNMTDEEIVIDNTEDEQITESTLNNIQIL